MTRNDLLMSRPKQALATLGLAVVPGGVDVMSGVNYTAQRANPGNSLASGTLTMSNSKDNVAILTASNIRPGDVTTGTVDIENTVSLSGTFTLSRTDLTNSDATNKMSEKMDLVVKDCGTF